MADSNAAKRTPARPRRASTVTAKTVSRPVTQTIEQIEARVVEVREAENEALGVLVTAMREIAVRCPVESRLPMILARHAKSIEEAVRLTGEYHSQATGTSNELYRLVNDLIDEQVGSAGDE